MFTKCLLPWVLVAAFEIENFKSAFIRRPRITPLWAFVFLVAIWDISFTIQYSDVIAEWDLNDVALAMLPGVGLGGVIGGKCLLTLFAWLCDQVRTDPWWSWLQTVLAGAALLGHGYVAVALAVGKVVFGV